MGSKTKIIAFFLLFCLFIPLALAQENPNVITIFNNADEVPERLSDDNDIEFNGITIISIYQRTFTPGSEVIEPTSFIIDFENEYSAEKLDLKDILKEGSVLNNQAYDQVDESFFFDSFLAKNPFVRYELKPLKVENWKVNNITLNGSIRVHATIYKHGFCSISLIFPIITRDWENEYNIKGDFLIADKPLKTDDIVFIEEFTKKIPLKGEYMTKGQIRREKYSNLTNKFFRGNGKNEELYPYKRYRVAYAWSFSENPARKLVEENPWEVCGLCAPDKKWDEARTRDHISSVLSEVFQNTPGDIQFFYPEGYGYFGYEQNPHQENLQDYGYNPRFVRRAELIYLHAYMLEIYNNKISKELEELKDVEEDQYPDKIKDIADLKKGIIISLEEFYLIEDSLLRGVSVVFIRYGKQRVGLDIVYENLRDKMEDLSEISADMYNVHAQESMRDLTKWMGFLTGLVLILTFILAGLGVYEPIRRFLEKRAKK
jgi:hypothetical protein